MSAKTACGTILAVGVLAASARGQEPRDEHQVRRAVERSLPVLLEKSLAWKDRAFGPKQVRCVSCHHLPMTVWAHHEAAARGFAVDRARVDALADYAVNHRYEPELVDGYLDTTFLSQERSPRTEQRLAAFAFFRRRLIDMQLPDGSWMVWDGRHAEEPGMQVVWKGAGADEDAKREATEVDTLWTLLGLAASERIAGEPDSHEAAFAEGRGRALAWIGDRRPRARNDWLAWRMLVEQRYGAREGRRLAGSIDLPTERRRRLGPGAGGREPPARDRPMPLRPGSRGRHGGRRADQPGPRVPARNTGRRRLVGGAEPGEA